MCGLFANWSETGNFWHAFFNLQFLPQTIIRTGASILLASLYVFLHAAWSFRNVSVANDPINSQLFDKIVRR
ncbi:MAG: hypothetical protein LBU34_01640, partial [Planctomycetaceae bacterium]|nr:hypothetical protein [Planctomycetaceae bacterium]